MSLSSVVSRVKLAAVLWRQGVWEALQLQRCVVYFVLDGSGKVLAQTTKCFVTNGILYLGSIVFHHHATQPAVSWLLSTYAEPAYGAAAVAAWQHVLALLFQLLWLGPLYLISLMVSCIWYQQIAIAAFEVQRQQEQQQQAGNPALRQQAPLVLPPPPPAAAGGAGVAAGGAMMRGLEGTAQEVFRVLLFIVFTVEVFISSLLPFVGPVVNLLLLSWLYAYYCYDYKWSLQGTRLPARMTFFEQNWAFFAGFGFPCVVATVFFPFHIGAALANMLFPVFVLVACASDPVAAQRSVMPSNGPSLGSIPIFKLALRPTYCLISRVFTKRDVADNSRYAS